jgi:phage tail protein X
MARRKQQQEEGSSFYEQIASTAVHLPAPVQDEIAAQISRIYSNQNLGPASQIGGMPFNLAELSRWAPGVQTVRDAEQLLANSVLAPAMGFINKHGSSFDDVIGGTYASIMGAARTYNPTHTEGRANHFAPYALSQARSTIVGETRAERALGKSLDAELEKFGDSGMPEPELGDIGVAPQPSWHKPLQKLEHTVGTSLFGPADAPMFVQGESGTILNPDLQTTPGKGLRQVMATPGDVRNFLGAYGNATRQRGVTPPVEYQLGNDLRQLAAGLRGGEQLIDPDTSDDRGWAPPGFGNDFRVDKGAMYGTGSLQAFGETRSSIFRHMRQDQVAPKDWQTSFSNRLRGSHANVVENLVGNIRSLAGSDPATAGAMYLQSHGPYGLSASDVAGIDVATPAGGRMALSSYVTEFNDELNEAMAVGGTHSPVGSLEGVLPTLNKSDVQAGVRFASGKSMYAPTPESRKEYGRASYAVESAQKGTLRRAEAKMGVARTVENNAYSDEPAVPEPEVPNFDAPASSVTVQAAVPLSESKRVPPAETPMPERKRKRKQASQPELPGVEAKSPVAQSDSPLPSSASDFEKFVTENSKTHEEVGLGSTSAKATESVAEAPSEQLAAPASPATSETVARLQQSVAAHPSAPEVTLKQSAQNARAALMGNREFVEGYPQWIGKGKESSRAFQEWTSDIGASTAWGALMKEHTNKERKKSGAVSQWSKMIGATPSFREAQRIAYAEETSTGVASTPSATPPAGAVSSGSGGGGGKPPPPAATPAPADDDFDGYGSSSRKDEPSSEDWAALSGQPDPRDFAKEKEAARRKAGLMYEAAAQKRDSFRHGDFEEKDPELAPGLRGHKVSDVGELDLSEGTDAQMAEAERLNAEARVPATAAQLKAQHNAAYEASRLQTHTAMVEGMVESGSGLADRLKQGIHSSLQGRLASGIEASRINQKTGRMETRSLKAGQAHGTFGSFVPADAGDFVGGDNSGRFVKEDGTVAVEKDVLAQGVNMATNAIDAAVGQGGLEGLSPREVAATLHKRISSAIQTIADVQLKEAEKGVSDPAEIDAIRKRLGQSSTVAYDALNRGVRGELTDMALSNVGDLSYSSRSIKTLEEFDAAAAKNPSLRQRVQDAKAWLSGPNQVVEADGETFDNFQGGRGGGKRGGGGFGDRLKSLYSSEFGHIMMAQFMGQMAWKSTGGSVFAAADKWAGDQAGYVDFANYGEGSASGVEAEASRREQYANMTGEMAYSQYGNLSGLGRAMVTDNPGIARIGNDLKMAAGIGTAVGVGTWALGSAATGLGAAGAGAALTAGAFPLALGAAAMVGAPALVGSMYNLATDQDSESGWSFKNYVSGIRLWDTLRDAKEAGVEPVGEAPTYAQKFKAFLGIGSAQEDMIEQSYGMSIQEFAKATGNTDSVAQWAFEGRNEQVQTIRSLSKDLQGSTFMKEDVIQSQLGKLQVSFGGLDTEAKQLAAKNVVERTADLGYDPMGAFGSIASMRGIKEGTDDFVYESLKFAGASQEEQQKISAQANLDYQKYAQWAGFVGGNGAAYSLFTGLGSPNTTQAQMMSSVMSGIEMSGETVTPELALSLGQQATSLAPHQAYDVSRTASSFSQMGLGGFSGIFSNLAGAVQDKRFGVSSMAGSYSETSMGIGGQYATADSTMQFISGVASGNQYALSDYGRLSDIGVLQTIDQNGLQTGMKDMSGLLRFAQQNMLKSPDLSGSETLAGLGLKFNATSESSLLSGGMWAYEADYTEKSQALQTRGLDMQYQQLGRSRDFMYRGWGLEDQQLDIQRESQLEGFAFSKSSMEIQHKYAQQDSAESEQRHSLSTENSRWQRDFNYATSLMQRDWSREDNQYNENRRSMQIGWQMEDMDEAIRRSSGYDRAMLVKQRDRATLSNNMEGQQIETQQDRQEEMWAREDERYNKSVEFQEQMIQMDEERLQKNREREQEMYDLRSSHLETEIASANALHEVRVQMESLQRERQLEQLEQQKKSLDMQKESQVLQMEYTKNVKLLNQAQTEMEASLRKITQYSPAFSRMLGDFLKFIQDASKVEVGSGSGSGYQVYR